MNFTRESTFDNSSESLFCECFGPRQDDMATFGKKAEPKTSADFDSDDIVRRCQEKYKHLLDLPIENRTTRDVYWDRAHQKFVLMPFTLESKKVIWSGKEEVVYKFALHLHPNYDSDYE